MGKQGDVKERRVRPDYNSKKKEKMHTNSHKTCGYNPKPTKKKVENKSNKNKEVELPESK
jgi:hypothetical protein